MRAAPSEPSPAAASEPGEEHRRDTVAPGPRQSVEKGNRVEHVIAPTQGWRSLRLGEVWAHRELLSILVWRNVKSRYKQTLLGVAWVVLQPLLLMLVFTLLFRTLISVPHEDVPYPLFVFAGLATWQLVGAGLNQASNSLVMNQQLITKVYFPRPLIPLSSVLSSLVDVAAAFAVLLVGVFAYGRAPRVEWLALPGFLLLGVLAVTGVALWLSALNVRYRDVQAALSFLLQLWFFLTPVIYSFSLIPGSWRLLLALNPMAGAVHGVRWSLFGGVPFYGWAMLVSAAVAALLLATGALYFRRVERTFVDLV